MKKELEKELNKEVEEDLSEKLDEFDEAPIEKKPAAMLSVHDLEVKFRVRDRLLNAIRGISLDIYPEESIAIVGESGSGKSVFTKTFNGMLEENGFISNGHIIFRDPDTSKFVVRKTKLVNKLIKFINDKLDKFAKLRNGTKTWFEIQDLKNEYKRKISISKEEREEYDKTLNNLVYERTEKFNYKLTLDPRTQKVEIVNTNELIKGYDEKIRALKKEIKAKCAANKKAVLKDKEYIQKYKTQVKQLKNKWKEEISSLMPKEYFEIDNKLSKEIYLSIGRYGFFARMGFLRKFMNEAKIAMRESVDFSDKVTTNKFFDKVVFRVKFINETESSLEGKRVINLARITYKKDWEQIRGTKIATIFQDPMTSLDPIITIGKQITSIIIKHQHVSEVEARRRAIDLMYKVGIPNAEKRFDDYPFQYSGGMRQRIVIAIALSCQPRILICDEPTTALDVTIQAQILKLIKDLQKEFHYTIVFITHDLGVVANIADRVAVLYGGQIVELGTVKEVFYDPKHPYTWALLSSLPQLAEKNTELFSISGTPPSLYNKIKGDAFAPRNPYCLKVDTLVDPPMFKVSETHYAKTWLLDPRAPKVKKPDIINDIHGKLIKGFNVTWEE